MIAVKEYTSAAEMRAEGAARRARLFNPSNAYQAPVRIAPVKAEQPRVPDLVRIEEHIPADMCWRLLPFHFKCKVFREHYREGDTSAELARRIARFTRFRPTASALQGVYFRAKSTMLTGITFTKKGSGGAWATLGRALENREKKKPTPEECACAVDLATVNGKIHVGLLIEGMCKGYGIPVTLILRHCNEVQLSLVRHKIMWVAKALSGKSYPQLKKNFDRDHTTILYGIKKMDRLIAAGDPSVADIKAWLRQ